MPTGGVNCFANGVKFPIKEFILKALEWDTKGPSKKEIDDPKGVLMKFFQAARVQYKVCSAESGGRQESKKGAPSDPGHLSFLKSLINKKFLRNDNLEMKESIFIAVLDNDRKLSNQFAKVSIKSGDDEIIVDVYGKQSSSHGDANVEVEFINFQSYKTEDQQKELEMLQHSSSHGSITVEEFREESQKIIGKSKKKLAEKIIEAFNSDGEGNYQFITPWKIDSINKQSSDKTRSKLQLKTISHKNMSDVPSLKNLLRLSGLPRKNKVVDIYDEDGNLYLDSNVTVTVDGYTF